MRALPLLLLAVALSLPASASAAALKPWVGLSGSLGKYSMGDVNRELELQNAGLAGTSLHQWPVGLGPGVGASAGVDFGRGFSLGVGYDRLFASSGVMDGRHDFKVRLPANAVRGIAEYAFPRRGALGARLGVSAGVLGIAGARDSAFVTHEVRGTAPLFETYLSGDWWGQPRCGVFATVGYRYARVDEVKVDGVLARDPDSSRHEVDYSGLMLRLGLKIPLGGAPAAAGAEPSKPIKPWLAVGGSWGGYGMSDVNHDLNTGVVQDPVTHVLAYTHLGLKQVSGGVGLGASAGLDFPGRITLGVGYDRLYASSKVSLPDVSLDYDLPANALRGFLEYRLPARGHFEPRLGIAGGALMLAGSASLPNLPLALDAPVSLQPVKGSGALAELYGGGEWRVGPRFAATAALGYRYAQAGELKWSKAILLRRGAPFVVDYGGLIARIGLKVALTK